MASTITGAKVIVVGGGLAGLSAAHTVLERGGRCLVLDKKEFLGGNSVKATSGINGALTNTQIKLGIPDSAAIFEKDTALSANQQKSADSTPLIHTLTYESAPAVEWLVERFNLDLSLISRLGGHSQPRTHRGKERFPGMTITYALMEKFEDCATQDPTRAQVIVSAKVTRLIEEGGAVTGVEYQHEGQTYTEVGPVVIATGGFGADFSDDSILKKVRPDLMHLPTTNGDHTTGDGIKLTQALGGGTIDLPAVQVHPTGLVHPKEPDAKIKFLAAEALRGVGGLILDNKGLRFCNELGTRDYVTGEMWSRKAAPYRLVLNGKGVKEIEWHIKHYCGRGLMKMCKGAEGLAKEIGVDTRVVQKTFKDYNEVAKKGSDEFGKKYFQNMPWDNNDEFAVAIVTPVIHYWQERSSHTCRCQRPLRLCSPTDMSLSTCVRCAVWAECRSTRRPRSCARRAASSAASSPAERWPAVSTARTVWAAVASSAPSFTVVWPAPAPPSTCSTTSAPSGPWGGSTPCPLSSSTPSTCRPSPTPSSSLSTTPATSPPPPPPPPPPTPLLSALILLERACLQAGMSRPLSPPLRRRGRRLPRPRRR